MFVYNQRPDRQLVFPLLDSFSTDPYTQGTITVGLLALVGGVSTVLAIFGLVRDRRDPE